MIDVNRAFEINSLLVQAWFVRGGVCKDEVPDFSGITLADAIEATRIVADAPPMLTEDGKGQLITHHVDEAAIPRLHAWALVVTTTTADLERICREHAQ